MTQVCIDCRYIGPRPSGIAEVVGAIVGLLPGLAPDLDFLLLSHPAHGRPLSQAPNVREVVVAHAANGPGTMWLLPRLVDLRGVDLFHAPANILPAGLSMRTVTTIHDVMWLNHPGWCANSWTRWPDRAFYRHGLKRALNRSSHIITVSEATRREVLDLRPELAAKTTSCLSGVSRRFQPVAPDRERLRRLGISDNVRYLLSVGQYAPYKNHEGAIRAFASAFEGTRGIILILVQRQGRGALRLRQLAEDLGISDQVQLLSAVEQDDLMHLYSGAAALLHPSFCEGFGNPLAEAMACGCPVITSNVSAMPEVTAGAAVTVPPTDITAMATALRSVLHDTSLARSMRDKGLARAQELQWSNTAARYLEVYRKVLESS